MVIVRVGGGLGNQLFHYAFARAYSIKNNCDVLLDISAFKNRRVTNDLSVGGQHSYYGLKLFKTLIKLATEEECRFVKLVASEKDITKPILKNLFRKHEMPRGFFIKDAPYSTSLFDYKGNVYFQGHFAAEWLFRKYREELLNELTLDLPLDDKNIKMLEQIKSTNSVSVHIRRGDYLVVKSGSLVLPISYYINAINYISSKERNLYFYFFSNDINWVKENLKINAPYTIVDINPPNKGYYDLELMKNCKHNIRANSTFSWWGAWLNQNPKKIVITPSKNKNLDLESWVLIEP